MRIIPVIVSLAFFMEAMDTTIINTSIPAMASSLHVDPINLKIALISYLLSLAIFIPISGWLADKFGMKRIFISAFVIFTLSSLWCGFSQNLTELVIARFLQGIGGALNLPVGRLIILRTFGRQQLIQAMSRVVMVGAVGMMLGPVLGGLITHYLSWHWIFWINLPIGLLAIGLATRGLNKDTLTHYVPPLDKGGFLLFGTALAALTFGLSAMSESTVSLLQASGVILVAMILFCAYILHSRHQPHPIVKTELLKLRTFRISVIGNLLSRLGFGGVPFLVPLLLQIGLGFSAQFSGLLLAPTAIGVLLVKLYLLPLLRLFGYKNLLILNTVLAALSLWSFIIVDVGTPFYGIACLTFFYGFIVSIQYSTMNTLAYANVPAEHMSAATSIMSTLQQLAQSFGVAVSALFLRCFSSSHPSLVLTPKIFHHTFFAVGLITLCSTLIYLHLKIEDGQQMI